MSSCALDISDQSIKYGELHSSATGLSLGRYGQAKIPPGVIVSGKIENEDRLVEVLKTLRIKEELHFVRVALPEEQMYLFTLSLPKVEGGDVRETILLSIEEHIPLSAGDTLFDYEVLSETDTTALVQVAAIAALTIESYLSVFDRAGLVPVSFELETQAIARAVIPKDDNTTMMIVDFGETRTGISIASGGKVLFTSTLDMGGKILTDMIAKNFSISFEEAEKMKLSYNLSSSHPANDIFPAIISGISVLRDEISKHMIYWGTHEDEMKRKRDPISKIVLCGGDSNLYGLADYFSVSMKIKVEHANTWVNISDMKNGVPDMPYEESLSYVTMLGLALGDYIYD